MLNGQKENTVMVWALSDYSNVQLMRELLRNGLTPDQIRTLAEEVQEQERLKSAKIFR